MKYSHLIQQRVRALMEKKTMRREREGKGSRRDL